MLQAHIDTPSPGTAPLLHYYRALFHHRLGQVRGGWPWGRCQGAGGRAQAAGAALHGPSCARPRPPPAGRRGAGGAGSGGGRAARLLLPRAAAGARHPAACSGGGPWRRVCPLPAGLLALRPAAARRGGGAVGGGGGAGSTGPTVHLAQPGDCILQHQPGVAGALLGRLWVLWGRCGPPPHAAERLHAPAHARTAAPHIPHALHRRTPSALPPRTSGLRRWPPVTAASCLSLTSWPSGVWWLRRSAWQPWSPTWGWCGTGTPWRPRPAPCTAKLADPRRRPSFCARGGGSRGRGARERRWAPTFAATWRWGRRRWRRGVRRKLWGSSGLRWRALTTWERWVGGRPPWAVDGAGARGGAGRWGSHK